MKLLKFAASVACVSALVHLCWSFALAQFAANYYARQMPNIRHLDEETEQRMGLATAFLFHTEQAEEPTVAFFGSSVTYGYPFAYSFTDTVQCEFPNHRIVNASTIGASLQMIRQHLLIAAENQIHFDSVVIEVPFVNDLPYLPDHRPSDEAIRASDASDRAWVRRHLGTSYFSFFVRLPWGVNHVAVLRDDFVRSTAEREFATTTIQKGYFASRERFDSLKPHYAEQILDVLRLAQAVSDHTYAFAMPVCLRGVREAGHDADALDEQIRFVESVCASMDGVQVLNLQESFLDKPKYFANCTHLNLRGNAAFGQWIASQLQTPADEEAVARRLDDASTTR